MDEKLNWDLGLDFSEVKEGLKKASASFDVLKKSTNETNRSLSNLDRGFNKTGRSATSFGSKIKKALSGLTKLVGLGTIVAMTFAAISGSVDGAISRLDTMNNYTNVMENLGVNAQDANTSIKWLSDGLKGLPTTLDDAVQSVQRFTSVNSNVLASTEMFLSLNNAILAGGAPIDQQRSALEQLSQAYAKGKPDMFEWRAAISAMPAQMKQVALSMGFMDTESLGESLRSGSTSMNDFMITVARLNNEGVDGMLSFSEQAKNSTGGVATSIANMKTAITRGLADIMDAIGRSNIASFFNKISAAISTAIAYVVAFINVFKSLLGVQSESKKETQGIAAASSNIASSGSNIADSFDDSAKSIKKAKKEMERLGQLGIDNLNILDDGSGDTDSGGGVGAAGASGAFGGLGDLGTIVPEVDISGLTKAQETAEKFRQKWLSVKDTIVQNKVPIISTLAAIGVGFLALQIARHWGDISNLFNLVKGGFSIFKLWTGEMGLLKGSFDLVATAIGSTGLIIAGITIVVAAVAGAIVQLWQTNETFRTSMINAWNGIKDTLNNIWTVILKPILESLGQMFKDIWNYALKPLWDGWVDFVGSVSVAMANLWTVALKPIVDWMISHFGPSLVKTFDLVSKTVSVVFAFIGQYIGTIFRQIGISVQAILGVFQGFITFFTGVFTGDWKKAWEGVKQIFKSVQDYLKNTWKNTWNFIIGLFSSGGKIFGGFVEGVANVFKKVVNVILSGINRVIAYPFDKINGMLNNIRAASFLGISPFKNLWGYNPIWVPQIPQFADGGIVSGRVFGEIGEYANARSNPEVVAPLDKLKSMISDAQATAEQNSLLREQNRLLKMIADKETDVVLDGEKVNKNINRQKRREARMKGKELAYT